MQVHIGEITKAKRALGSMAQVIEYLPSKCKYTKKAKKKKKPQNKQTKKTPPSVYSYNNQIESNPSIHQ
jgi:hypothetical protein